MRVAAPALFLALAGCAAAKMCCDNCEDGWCGVSCMNKQSSREGSGNCAIKAELKWEGAKYFCKQYCEARGRRCVKSADNVETNLCEIVDGNEPGDSCLVTGFLTRMCVCGPQEWESQVPFDKCFFPEDRTTTLAPTPAPTPPPTTTTEWVPEPENDAAEEEPGNASIKDAATGPRFTACGMAAAVCLAALGR